MMTRMLATTFILFVAGVAQSAPPPELRLKWGSGKLSLDAENVPLSRVLEAVSIETGTEITGGAELGSPISVHIAETELIQALQELLTGVDYAISAGSPVTRVLIVSKRKEPARTAPTADAKPDVQTKPAADPPENQSAEKEAGETQAPPGDPAENTLAAIETAATDRDSTALKAYLRDGDTAVQASAFQALATQSKDAAIESLAAEIQDTTQPNRLQALQLMVQSSGASEPVIMDTLRDALRDPDPAFNAYAIQTLAGYGNADAMEALTAAFHGMDAATRLTIVQSVASTQAGLQLLQEAASDSDVTVSAAAKDLLKQLTARP